MWQSFVWVTSKYWMKSSEIRSLNITDIYLNKQQFTPLKARTFLTTIRIVQPLPLWLQSANFDVKLYLKLKMFFRVLHYVDIHIHLKYKGSTMEAGVWGLVITGQIYIHTYDVNWNWDYWPKKSIIMSRLHFQVKHVQVSFKTDRVSM